MVEANKIDASRKRIFLAWYIDFLFFMTVWALISYFIKPHTVVPFWIQLVVFVVVRIMVKKIFGSVGLYFLSIDKKEMAVARSVFEKESWITLFIGVLFVLDGTKLLVRWTEVFVSQPVLGYFPDDTVQIALQIVQGTLSVLAGYWFLKMDMKGLVLGLALTLFSIVSVALSWNLWDPVIEEKIVKRNKVQGLAVNQSEIEGMQLLMPELVLIFMAIMLMAMVASFSRFRDS